jgi:hypothetical protein
MGRKLGTERIKVSRDNMDEITLLHNKTLFRNLGISGRKENTIKLGKNGTEGDGG